MSEGNIVDFPGNTVLDIPPEKVLEEAKKHGLTTAFVIGEDGEGELYFAGSTIKIGSLLILVERAKMQLIEP